ncbi:MAG: hypothetical protein H0W08_15415 [Acidobacteria bacterium]|nr:hypothetical protein [Acidobacteriota bacterium]
MLIEAMPSRNASLFTSRRSTWLFMGGRLKDGVDIAQANAELEAIGAALEREHPDINEQMRFGPRPSRWFRG